MDLVFVETAVALHPTTLGSIRLGAWKCVAAFFFKCLIQALQKKRLRLMRAACSEAYRLRE